MIQKLVITVSLLFSILISHAINSDIPKQKGIKASILNGSSFVPSEKGNSIVPVWGFFIDSSVGMSTIMNSNLSSEVWNSKSNLGYTFNLGYFHSFGSLFRIKTGLGFTSYSSSLTGNGEVLSSQFMDIDNDSYTETLILSDAQKTFNPMYLSLPILFEIGNLSINKTGLYLDLGFKYSFLFNENNKNQGTYTTKGNYDQWGVTIEDVEELGFYLSKDMESNVGFKKNNYSIIANAGVTIPVSGVVILKLGITGSFGLKDIGGKASGSSDISPLTEEAYQFRSQYIDNTFAVKKGSKTAYIGFEIGLYFNKQVK